MPAPRVASLVTLGCARNEVDSEELAARLAQAGWRLDGTAGADTDVVLVNTCGFIDAAKKDSIDTLLDAASAGATVVAVGCLAERYGRELAEALPEATVLSFDDYPAIADRLDDVLAGRPLAAHTPRDRRALLPLAPVARPPAAASGVSVPGHGLAAGPRLLRHRLSGGPVAPLKIASGCDRRCSFCAIPSFRGSFVSRPAGEVLAEAAWLAGDGVREVVLVSENSTSYGKDLGDLAALEDLLGRLAQVPGLDRVRVSYLQPAEMRPGLVRAIGGTPGVAPYFDLSFQHASPAVLRRMRRFGGSADFLRLVDTIRDVAPAAGIRSNVIVGFPGETVADVDVLMDFLAAARLDAVGVFGYSAQEGTEAVGLPDACDEAEVAARIEAVQQAVEELTAQRAEDRVGERVDVLVERLGGGGTLDGRAAHQAPEVDGTVRVTVAPPAGEPGAGPTAGPGGPVVVVGDLVTAVVTGSTGVDLLAVPVADAERLAGRIPGAPR